MNRLGVVALIVALAVVVPSIALATTASAPTSSTADITSLARDVGAVSGELELETDERVRLGSQLQESNARLYALEHQSDFKWTEILTAIVAMVALGVSIYSLTRQSPRVVVSATYSLLGSMGGDVSDPMVSLTAANIGGGRVVLSSSGLLVPDGEKIVWGQHELGSTQLPHVIEGGDSATVIMSISRIATALKRNGHTGDIALSPFFRDQTGKTHDLSSRRYWLFWRKKAKFFIKDIDRWAAEFGG